MKKKTDTTEVLLVGYNTDKEDGHILIVGKRRPRGTTDILNMFTGQEADELYQKLITAKEKENTNVDDN